MRTSVSMLNDQVWLPSGPGVAVSAGTVAWASASSGKASRSASSRPGVMMRIMSVDSTPFQGSTQCGCKAGRIERVRLHKRDAVSENCRARIRSGVICAAG